MTKRIEIDAFAAALILIGCVWLGVSIGLALKKEYKFDCYEDFIITTLPDGTRIVCMPDDGELNETPKTHSK